MLSVIHAECCFCCVSQTSPLWNGHFAECHFAEGRGDKFTSPMTDVTLDQIINECWKKL
jgi:hypothetical protein